MSPGSEIYAGIRVFIDLWRRLSRWFGGVAELFPRRPADLACGASDAGSRQESAAALVSRARKRPGPCALQVRPKLGELRLVQLVDLSPALRCELDA